MEKASGAGDVSTKVRASEGRICKLGLNAAVVCKLEGVLVVCKVNKE